LGKTIKKDFVLKQKVGKLQFSVTPLEATAELSRDGKTMQSWQGLKIIKDIQVGDYELTVKNNGYKTTKKTIKIEENITSQVDIILEKGSDIPENMVFVKGETFQMGSSGGDSNEKPIHGVTLSDFYISKYEVTFAEYDKFCESTGRTKPSDKGWGRGNRPVINVSWNDAAAYCTWAGGRLPTEAEWEYAAKGGNQSRGYTYSGSNTVENVAWYYGNSGSKTHEVGTKQPNELGIYDMSGNVWELCNDWYDKNYYKDSPKTNPQGPSSGTSRVLRGGSWSNITYYCRSAYRFRYLPSNSYFNDGFRFVQD